MDRSFTQEATADSFGSGAGAPFARLVAFKGYAAILIWIQLWPPLYAVLNYMASIYASYDLAAAADLGAGVKALSPQTA